jgi:hypothetical protein
MPSTRFVHKISDGGGIGAQFCDDAFASAYVTSGKRGGGSCKCRDQNGAIARCFSKRSHMILLDDRAHADLMDLLLEFSADEAGG